MLPNKPKPVKISIFQNCTPTRWTPSSRLIPQCHEDIHFTCLGPCGQRNLPRAAFSNEQAWHLGRCFQPETLWRLIGLDCQTERITNGAYFKGLPRNFLNSPEWRILRRPPNGYRCRWFWGITRVMWPNQATCTMYKMPILTTGLKAPPLVLRDKMGRFLTFMLYGWTMSHFTFHTVQSVWLRPPSGVHFLKWWRSLLS